MRFIEKESTGVVYTNFQDEVLAVRENEGVYEFGQDGGLELCRKKVESYIRENQDNLTIQRNYPVTKLDLEELDNKLFEASGIDNIETYRSSIYPNKSLCVFIRELVGLDRGAAKEAFSDYLDEAKFNSQQIRFVNTISISLLKTV